MIEKQFPQGDYYCYYKMNIIIFPMNECEILESYFYCLKECIGAIPDYKEQKLYVICLLFECPHELYTCTPKNTQHFQAENQI